jgi:hypothetical protein
MRYFTLGSLLVGALACCSQATAQLASNIRPCPAGIQADGLLDWTKLPTAQQGVALNATIPVPGIQGLTATVQIPATGIASIYPYVNFVVDSPIDLNVAANDQVTLIFSQPVRGVSTSIGLSGRFVRTVSMSAYGSASEISTSPSAAPPGAQVAASALDVPSPGDLATVPLQIRSESPNIGAVVIQFEGASDEDFSYDITNLRIESGVGPDLSKQVPTSGLKQWLRADSIYQPYPPAYVSSWPDQSGNHADATSPGGFGAALPDGPNCSPVVKFGGTSGLSANVPINGWTGMTVFLVSKSSDSIGEWWLNQPLFWADAAPWGATFVTPSQSNVFFRFGTGQVNNEPMYTRPVNVGGDYTLTTAIHDSGTDRLYLNGLLALSQGGKTTTISGVSSTEQIGAGLFNTFFTGAIGEILVYDRALGDDDRAIVEHYLMKKFGLF